MDTSPQATVSKSKNTCIYSLTWESSALRALNLFWISVRFFINLGRGRCVETAVWDFQLSLSLSALSSVLKHQWSNSHMDLLPPPSPAVDISNIKYATDVSLRAPSLLANPLLPCLNWSFWRCSIWEGTLELFDFTPKIMRMSLLKYWSGHFPTVNTDCPPKL